ncbi:MAG: hypothetical protein WAL29_02330 [Bacteroidales bacterium]
MEEQFIFRKEYRNILVVVMAVSLLVALASILVSRADASRIWANVLLNNQFFLGISLGAAFFIAVHRVAMSGWHTVLQRLPESMTSFLPVALVLMLLIYFGMNSIYHWSHYEGYDPILEGKKAWLNIPFFFIRMVIYFTGWIALTWLMKRNSDMLVSSSDIRYYNRRKIFAGVFLVFFGITVSTSSWDWIMSIDAEWYSSIFGWYVFISMFVTSLSFIILLAWLLRRQGYLTLLRDEHVHDLAILLFSFSIFWTYQWFSQYLLIWYGHLPDETIYFIPRQKGLSLIFFLNLGINFLVPFFGLIRSRSKKNLSWVAFIAAVVFVGHWLDYWLMIMPGAVGENAAIGLLEISATVLYAGLFVFVFFRSLARGPVIVKNDPFLEESLSYES